MKYFWIFVAVSLFINGVAFIAFISAPEAGALRGYIVTEDGLVENLTAALFMGIFLFALALLRRRANLSRPDRNWLILLAALGLLGLLDEISFGARLFDLTAPLFGNTEMDSLHDVLQFGSDRHQGLVSRYRVPLLLAIVSTFSLAIFFLPRLGKTLFGDVRTEKYRALYVVMSCFVVLIVASQLLDLQWWPIKGHQALEECFEPRCRPRDADGLFHAVQNGRGDCRLIFCQRPPQRFAASHPNRTRCAPGRKNRRTTARNPDPQHINESGYPLGCLNACL